MPGDLKICRIFGAKQSSGNLFLAGLPNQIIPIALRQKYNTIKQMATLPEEWALPEEQTSGRLLSCRLSAENQVIRGNGAQTHTLIASEATRPPELDHLLRDQSRGFHSEVMFEINCRKSDLSTKSVSKTIDSKYRQLLKLKVKKR